MQDMDRICGTIAIVLLALLVYNMHKESTQNMRRSVSACSMASKESQESQVSAKSSLNIESKQPSQEAYEIAEDVEEQLSVLSNTWNPTERKNVSEETTSMLDKTIAAIDEKKLEAHMSSSCNTKNMSPQQIVKKQTMLRTTQNDGRQTHARNLGQANVVDIFRRSITGEKLSVKPPKEEMFALNTEAATQARLSYNFDLI